MTFLLTVVGYQIVTDACKEKGMGLGRRDSNLSLVYFILEADENNVQLYSIV